MFINILNNSRGASNNFGMYINSQEETSDASVLDYNLYLDDITLVKGKMPTEDYEVIVNNINKDTMKLNKTIKTKVNDKELKVVRILRK